MKLHAGKRQINDIGRVNVSRRDILSAAAMGIVSTYVPGNVLGKDGNSCASDRLNIAGVGVGGKGRGDISCLNENIVALCDVDFKFASKAFNSFPKAAKYRDFRKMLDKQPDIDAVVIATPDHTHAVIALAAIAAGKHIYCQKPLAHSIYDVRRMTEAARKAGIVTQMGNQLHATNDIRLVCEMIWDGAVGNVHTVHAWTDRPGGKYPSKFNIPRPRGMPVPKSLDWDLWLGPALERPYNSLYHPFGWRAFRAFGTGALGDMGCHILDAPFWALKLGYPTSVEGSSTGVQMPKEIRDETFPMASLVHYHFPARDNLPPVDLHWYDGGLMPTRPAELPESEPLCTHQSGGLMFIGDKGILLTEYAGGNPRLLPMSLRRDYKPPAPSLPRIQREYAGHRIQWTQACKTVMRPDSNFDYAGPLTEVVLLGCLATRMNTRLLWDGDNMKVTNIPEANDYLRDEYRPGWEC